MKIITCVGYHATGASVVEDLLRECDNMAYGRRGHEVRFLHDLDGVSDLEYHLVTDPHRSTSAPSIKRFIRRYSKEQQHIKVFGPHWTNLIIKYAESLAAIKFKGWRESDTEFLPQWRREYTRLKVIANHFLPKKIRKPSWYDWYPDIETYYGRLTEEEFLYKTKELTDELCKLANPANKEFLLLDQLASSHNPQNVQRYFNDEIKIIIVDRDPRDLYIDVVRHKVHKLPWDPKFFSIQYRLMRKNKEALQSNVLHVNMEDMIYKYDEFTKKVFGFLGIDASLHHVHPREHFNPAVSVFGTRQWKRYPQFSDAINVLERELQDMLYDFSDARVVDSGIDEKVALAEYEKKV